LHFENGELVGVNNETFDHPSEAIQYLQTLASHLVLVEIYMLATPLLALKVVLVLKQLHPWLF
jgi:argininosuccinate synthase